MAGGHDPRVRIERRLGRPRWLLFAVPAGSIVFASPRPGSCCSQPGTSLAAYRQISTRPSVKRRAIGHEFVRGDLPLAFTGLAAAAAHFRMHFNRGEASS